MYIAYLVILGHCPSTLRTHFFKAFAPFREDLWIPTQQALKRIKSTTISLEHLAHSFV